MSQDTAIDCHIHIVGSADTYPLDAKRRYTPAPASTDAYWQAVSETPVSRTVVVQPSFYGTDNTCLLDALRVFGPRARGVAVMDIAELDDRVLQDFQTAGVRGLRLNVLSSRTGATPLAETLGQVDAALRGSGWHIQVLCDPTDFDFLCRQQESMAADLVLDHFGFLRPDGTEEERAGLLRLVGAGAWVKLSGTDRLTRGKDTDWFQVLANEIAALAPDRVVWGSDWPHTPLHGAVSPERVEPVPPRPVNTAGLFQTAESWFEDPTMRRRLFRDNPERLYDFRIE